MRKLFLLSAALAAAVLCSPGHGGDNPNDQTNPPAPPTIAPPPCVPPLPEASSQDIRDAVATIRLARRALESHLNSPAPDPSQMQDVVAGLRAAERLLENHATMMDGPFGAFVPAGPFSRGQSVEPPLAAPAIAY